MAHSKIISFDSLRFFAAIFIVLHHIQITFGGNYLKLSYLAVEIFFVLSGFLLARTYESSTHLTSSIAECYHYFIKRFLRLWPEYIFAIFLALCLRNTYGHSVAIQPFFLNLIMMTGQGGIPFIQYGMWYIAVLLWGGCFLYNLLVFGKEKTKCLLLPLISFLCLFYLVNHGGIYGYEYPVYFHLINHGMIRGLLGLTVGIYTYLICNHLRKVKLPIKKHWLPSILLFFEAISVVSLCYTLILALTGDISDFNIYFFIAYLIGLLSFHKENIFKFLSWKIWIPFGKVSYMLFLTHFIIIDIFYKQFDVFCRTHFVLTYFFIIALSIVFAFCCSWWQKCLFHGLKSILLKKNLN